MDVVYNLHRTKIDINLEDNVNMVTKKICVSLGLQSLSGIYIWATKSVSNDDITQFVVNVFQNQKTILFTDFSIAVKNHFGIDLSERPSIVDATAAYSILTKKKPRECTVPISFCYMNNNYFAHVDYNGTAEKPIDKTLIPVAINVCLEGFDIKGKTLHVSYFHKKTFYTPFFEKEDNIKDVQTFVKSVYDVEKDILKHRNRRTIRTRSYTQHYAVTSGKVSLNEDQDLSLLFNSIVCDTKTVFMKYKTATQTYYKFNKDHMKELNDDAIEQWTMKSDNNKTYMVFKVLLNENRYASVVLYTNLCYDIRFSFDSKTKESDIYKYFPDVNYLLGIVSDLYKTSYVSLVDKHTKIKEIFTRNILHVEDHLIDIDKLEHILNNRFGLYFYIFNSNPNVFNMKYKMVDNFSKRENVGDVIAKYKGAPDDDIIQAISESLHIGLEEAKDELERYNDLGPEKVYKKWYNNGVTIDINKRGIQNEIVYNIRGHTSWYINERINSLITYAIDMTFDKKEVSHDIDDSEIHSNSSNTVNSDEVEEEAVDSDFEVNMNVVKEKVKILREEPKKDSPKRPEPLRVSTGLLAKLQERDRKLFLWETKEGDKTYARHGCTSSANRHPIVVSKTEYTRINGFDKDAIENFVRTGSDKDHAERNLYICPKIWCPISRLAYSEKRFEEVNRRCPGDGEKPILFDGKYWGPDALSVGHYANFIDHKIHPQGFCLPCCFKRNNEENRKCITNIEDTPQQKESANPDDKKYIKKANYIPVDQDRYGMLQERISQAFSTNQVCGLHADGSGTILKTADCYVRKGIPHMNQQLFLNSVASIFQMSYEEVVNKIANITLDQFLLLENGKVFRIFADETKSITHYKEDLLGFLNTQDRYRKRYGLDRLLALIKNNTFNTEVMREFMIYTSYNNFRSFVEDRNIYKDHRPLLDCVSTVFNCNIIVLDNQKNKTYVLCSARRMDAQKGFAYIVKSGLYYEPVVRITYTTRIKEQYLFSYSDNVPLANFVTENCNMGLTDKSDIKNFLLSNGYKIKYYVIDYSYLVRGVILNNLLYVPFKNKLEFGLDMHKLVYYNEVPKFKCRDWKEVYKLLASKDPFYKLSKRSDKYLILKDGTTVVPLDLGVDDYTYRMFNDDLNITIMHEEEDERKAYISTTKTIETEFEVYLKAILKTIATIPELNKELNFLVDSSNPFPRAYKRKRMYSILKNIVSLVEIKSTDSKEAHSVLMKICDTSCVHPCEGDKGTICMKGIKIDDHIHRLVDAMLLKSFVSRAVPFKIHAGEVMFTQSDITNQKHLKYVDGLRNPYKILEERIDKYIEKYLVTKKSLFEDFTEKYGLDDRVEMISNFKKLLAGFSIIERKDNEYNPSFIYDLFVDINNSINPESSSLTLDMLKSIIKTYVRYESQDNLEIIRNSPGFSNLYLQMFGGQRLRRNPTVEETVQVISHDDYYPSFYELAILSDIVKVNIVVLQRKKKNDTSLMSVLNKKYLNYIVLRASYQEPLKRYKFDLVYKDRTGIFTASKLPKGFLDMVNVSQKIIYAV